MIEELEKRGPHARALAAAPSSVRKESRPRTFPAATLASLRQGPHAGRLKMINLYYQFVNHHVSPSYSLGIQLLILLLILGLAMGGV